MEIKKILAPTDCSELSLVGLRHALEIAQSQQAEIIVYYAADSRQAVPHPSGFQRAYSPDSPRNVIQEFVDRRKEGLEKLLRGNFPELIEKVTVRQEVDIGVARERIVEMAEKEGVDIIVMSTHGRTGLPHMFLGSVTEHVVRRAPCPVLSVPPSRKPKSAKVEAA
jgi:nucleotide-binding universal stress UspA family protein